MKLKDLNNILSLIEHFTIISKKIVSLEYIKDIKWATKFPMFDTYSTKLFIQFDNFKKQKNPFMYWRLKDAGFLLTSTTNENVFELELFHGMKK